MNDIYVVGDVHGNYPKLKTALYDAVYLSGDDVIFAGDLMDRGCYNGKVANFVARLGKKAHVIQGNHEQQHRRLMPYYQAILDFGSPYPQMAAEIFKNYRPGVWWPETNVECRCWQCPLSDILQERANVLSHPAASFQEAARRFVVYTIAWEDVRLWGIISMLLKDMCGPPYNAEHTLYEYFSAGPRTRQAMENIWNSTSLEAAVSVKVKPWKRVIVTHSNPFGASRFSKDRDNQYHTAARNIHYVFGHIPVKSIEPFVDEQTNCTYTDIDLSPRNVGVLKIT